MNESPEGIGRHHTKEPKGEQYKDDCPEHCRSNLTRGRTYSACAAPRDSVESVGAKLMLGGVKRDVCSLEHTWADCSELVGCGDKTLTDWFSQSVSIEGFLTSLPNECGIAPLIRRCSKVRRSTLHPRREIRSKAHSALRGEKRSTTMESKHRETAGLERANQNSSAIPIPPYQYP